ncbi:uncharacterized protein LOC121378443 isoform X1 [Gigantopelta aegis]|uniref:uncharacterized protein LOC121378443 isoform X1 n=1 Tax=Gigantopelta aegis TaxID=1735272 RepID=UPI001B88990E|nr:uncharacterized protein LOC121378443 isoform X1 [Gigantopelta aegis]
MMTGSGIVFFFPIVLFVSWFSQTCSVQYKCYRDICDSSRQFCNDDEQRCEACGEFECSGQNSYVKLDQCNDACKRLGLVTTISPKVLNATPPPKETQSTNGISTELIISCVILCFVIIIFVVLITAVICWYRKCTKIQFDRKYMFKHPAEEPLLKQPNGDIEMGPIRPQKLPTNCTEDRENHKDPSAPPSYESESPICQATSSFHGTTESHPANADFLAEDQRYEQAERDERNSLKDTELHEVTPKSVVITI